MPITQTYDSVMETHTPGERMRAALAELDETTDPQQRIATAQRIRQLAEELELAQVRSARERGTSWSKIGAIYGLTKQGAQQRFRKTTKRDKGAADD